MGNLGFLLRRFTLGNLPLGDVVETAQHWEVESPKSAYIFYWLSYPEQLFNISEVPLYLPVNWKWPWCWEKLRVGEGGDRGWDGWMESLTQRTCVWANSGRWWRIGKPGVLQVHGVTKSDMTKQLNDTSKQLTLSLSMKLHTVVQLFSGVQLFATSRTAACMPGFPILHYLLEFAQTHVHWVSDAI